MRRSARCSPPGRARCSTWVAASGWSARPSAGRWWSVTVGVCSRAVTGHRPSPMPTTCGTGSTAAPPTWPTWRWSAGATTGWCTPADQRQVGQVGGAAVDPVPEVVGVGERRWPVTARPDAPAVADHQRPALGRADQPDAATQVEHLARPGGEHRADRRIAGQPQRRAGTQRPGPVQGGGAGAGEQGGQVDPDLQVGPLARTGTATLDWAGPLTAGAALRLACDATISPVLTAGPSEVLDLGRSVRLVSPAQRRALVVRDGGCVWPGCDRPPAFTDAHHLRHWVDGAAVDPVPQVVGVGEG